MTTSDIMWLHNLSFLAYPHHICSLSVYYHDDSQSYFLLFCHVHSLFGRSFHFIICIWRMYIILADAGICFIMKRSVSFQPWNTKWLHCVAFLKTTVERTGKVVIAPGFCEGKRDVRVPKFWFWLLNTEGQSDCSYILSNQLTNDSSLLINFTTIGFSLS